MTLRDFCFAAGMGILTFCILCGIVFGILALIDHHQHSQRDRLGTERRQK